MAITNRTDFGEYCLRALGKPVINIDVTAEQLSDRIDEALDMFAKYHFDGTKQVYYKYQLTSQDIANNYITLPDNILGAVDIFPLFGNAYTGTDIFDVRYQIVMNELFTLTHTSLLPYVMTMTRLNEMQEILVGRIPIRYTKIDQKLYLDMDWATAVVGGWIVVHAYEVIDADQYPKIFKDTWLKRYATALVKRQWGTNLSKFNNMQLPGGISLNGSQIFEQAESEIEKLEQELEDDYMLMPLDRMA